LVIGGVAITAITPSITACTRGTIDGISVVIGNLPITVLA
jgi:hypothetical protein